MLLGIPPHGWFIEKPVDSNNFHVSYFVVNLYNQTSAWQAQWALIWETIVIFNYYVSGQKITTEVHNYAKLKNLFDRVAFHYT